MESQSSLYVLHRTLIFTLKLKAFILFMSPFFKYFLCLIFLLYDRYIFIEQKVDEFKCSKNGIQFYKIMIPKNKNKPGHNALTTVKVAISTSQLPNLTFGSSSTSQCETQKWFKFYFVIIGFYHTYHTCNII